MQYVSARIAFEVKASVQDRTHLEPRMVECFGHLVSLPLLNLEEFVDQIDGCSSKGNWVNQMRICSNSRLATSVIHWAHQAMVRDTTVLQSTC